MLSSTNPFDYLINRFSEGLLFCLALFGPKNQRLSFEAWAKMAGLGISVNLCLYLICPVISNERELKLVGIADCAVRPTVLLCVELRGQPSLGTGARFVQLGQELAFKKFAQGFSESTINRFSVIRGLERPKLDSSKRWVHASCRTLIMRPLVR
jgi:hypothetical protein